MFILMVDEIDEEVTFKQDTLSWQEHKGCALMLLCKLQENAKVVASLK